MNHRLKTKNLVLLISFLCTIPLACFCQTQTYEAVIQDSITHKNIADAHIYLGKDTVGFKNNMDGSFLIQAKKGSVIRLRKPGYLWLNVEIQEHTPKVLRMSPSSRSLERQDKIGEMIVDGKNLPKEEWNDINSDYVKDMTSIMKNGKFKLIITTK